MESSKILPISVGVAGFTILLFSIAQANKTRKGKAYQDGNLTAQSINAKDIATTLYNAMKQANFTNTEKRKTILTTLTGINEAQFSWIVKAFGKRYYNRLTGNTYFALWQTPVKHPLKVWLKEELSDSDYQLLKSNYPKYL
ncbi:hypothetical protein NAT51_14830 [Flavobacterium amniphilum]|uniref:hypothetical protein n=1 Tax=Flavobacterium amniphilum TaxID=1834035 RepID=UPI00202A10D4|nr:hypothetical protein [Flavobacterium amniphilum]MCL9806807.1 hypothetical protein [Flavobacterium amniphilum]